MKEKKRKVLVVIPNYNGGSRIRKCLDSVLDQTWPDLEVVVVDNASTDGSDRIIQDEYPSVRFIQTGYNAGWGIACNTGIHSAASDYVALFNNDAWMEKTCIAEMVAAIESRDDYGACASRILLWDEPDRIEVCGLVIHRDGSSCGRGRLESSEGYLEAEEVFCANDCCCLYRRSMLEEVGDYDPDFFIYCDETEMGWRHQLAGWKCIYTPKAVAYHAHSQAAGSYSAFKAFHVERNRLYITFKCFPLSFLAVSLVLAPWRYLYQCWLAASGGRGALAHYRKENSLWDGFRVLVRAWCSAFSNLPKMWRRRKQILGKRKLDNAGIEDLFRKYGISTRHMAGYE